jgi:single-stranded-DNA-specific exonuclease
MSVKRWKLKKYDHQVADLLQRELKIHPILCQLLASREISDFEEAKHFFRPSLSHLYDPFLMDQMDAAITRIKLAVEHNQKILFYGDYDVDGTTAVSLMSLFFKKFYPNFSFYIPDRYSEGYGISYTGLDFARDHGFELIIALDCGITAVEQVAYAKSFGIDFIICDHHLPSDILPEAIAILNPKKKTCSYPFKELSGCGVGFKLCQAIVKTFELDESFIYDLIDLTCASIASDIVPIVDENRVLAYFGLKKINENPIHGFKALLENQKTQKTLSISDLVFIIGPRINAPGRMAHANAAVELLTCETLEEARAIATELNKFNLDRREADSSITIDAISNINEIENYADKRTIVLSSPEWHKGVVGIVASRIVEKYYRPTIILAENEDGILTGSARSIKGFSIYEGLKKCSDLLIKYGGHDYAAGLSITKENFPLFVDRLEQVGMECITDDLLVPEVEIDSELPLYDITPKFYNIMEQMAPFGPANMRPVFCTKKLRDNGKSRIVGKNNHLKLEMMDEMNTNFSAIGWGFGDYFDAIKDKKYFDICYTIEENEWNGKVSLQLNIKDIKIHDT